MDCNSSSNEMKMRVLELMLLSLSLSLSFSLSLSLSLSLSPYISLYRLVCRGQYQNSLEKGLWNNKIEELVNYF